MRVPLLQRVPDCTTAAQQSPHPGYAVDPGPSRRRVPPPAVTVLTHVLSPNEGLFAETEPTVVRSHKPRDWEDRHAGSNFGYIFGGIIFLVGLTLAGGYSFARWQRLRLLKRRVTNATELDPSENPHRSVDLAPLLPNAEHWKPALSRISEHTEEPSGSTIRLKEPSDHAKSSLNSRSLRPSGEEYKPLLVVDASRITEPVHEREEYDEENALRDNSTSYEHWHPPVAQTRPQPSTPPQTATPWNLSIPQVSTSPTEAVLSARDNERITSHSEAPFPQPGRHPFARELDLETPNVSASDSDSMQVNIPWRNSSRFIPPRAQSLPLESSNPESPPVLTPGNERTSFSQPTEVPPSLLHLRALEEEDREASQLSSKTPSMQPPTRHASLETDRPTTAESSRTSTLSSLSKLRFRMTGSAPFLPLIEESSPLDTDRLFSRLKGGPSRRSSMSSKKSRQSHKPVAEPPSPPPITSIMTPLPLPPTEPPTPASTKPPSPPRIQTKPNSIVSSVSTSPSLSPSPSPSAFPLPPTSPHDPDSQPAKPLVFTPIMHGASSLPSMISHSRVSSSRSQSSPYPISNSGDPSGSSIAHLPSPAQLLESPPMVLQPLTAPRRLPIRPLPGLPPSTSQALSSNRNLVIIPDTSLDDADYERFAAPSPQTPWVDGTPIASSDDNVPGRFTQDPSKPLA